MITLFCKVIKLNQIIKSDLSLFPSHLSHLDRLCGLVVSVADYKHRGPGFDSRALLRIFLRDLGLELSLVIG
jgi:hypothetical protein